MNAARVPYAGIASRAIALAVDVLIANVIVLTGGAILALVESLVGAVRLDAVTPVLAGVAWVAVVGAYFVLFWSTAGQTPGMRLLDLRVIARNGGRPGVARSMLRLLGLALAAAPMFAGFLPVLIDDRRRALQDFIARTVVVYGELADPVVRDFVGAPVPAEQTPHSGVRAGPGAARATAIRAHEHET